MIDTFKIPVGIIGEICKRYKACVEVVNPRTQAIPCTVLMYFGRYLRRVQTHYD